MVTVFTLTPESAAQALQDNGLDALGLTALRLAAKWGSATPSFNSATLQLTPSGNAFAPFFGTLEFLKDGSQFRDVNGNPISGNVAAFRLHPQAVARLDQMMASRYAMPNQPHHRVVPETLVFSNLATLPNQSPQTYAAGASLARSEPMSFHDNRGLIIDPIAVAAIYVDLITEFPALQASTGNITGNGSVSAVAGLASGIEAQVCDLHGRPYQAVPNGPTVEKHNSGGTSAGTPDAATGLITLATGESLAGSGDSAASRLRIGWATGGEMQAVPLSPPELPSGISLDRQFLRAFAVDLDWHLLGNRTTTEVKGIPAEDGKMPDDLKPKVRDQVQVDYVVDGPDLLARSKQIIDRIGGASDDNLVFAVSPLLQVGVGLPPSPGPQAHWPAFPAPGTASEFSPDAPAPLEGATATWTDGNDVVVEITADRVPDGASLRIYSQQFQLIESIGETPSFLRGDGGTAIAAADSATKILVTNPLGLQSGDPKPDPSVLVFDLIITPRQGKRRLFANRRLTISAGPATVPADPFGTPDPMAALGDNIKSICPAPLFGMQRTTTPAGGLSNPIDIVRALGSETEPREGPRHPTMGRLESIIVSGLEDNTALQEGLRWEAVLSGARWARETLSARFRDGNPGNPAGPDTFSGGVAVDGALGYDLARHAIRRVQPILPLLGGASTTTSPGWIVMSDGDNMNPPSPSDSSPPPAGSSSGVLLQTVAAVADTPELSLLPDSNPLASSSPISLNDMLDTISSRLRAPLPAGSLSQDNANRIINEVRREYYMAKQGSRDALWSLTGAISEAEELVYIQTAGFAVTARPSGTPQAHEIDLVKRLADRMNERKNLKVIICTPRESDLAPAPFARRALKQRQEAIETLTSVDGERVAAFHPRGFPGRFMLLRTTTVIVDDVWSLVGATHFRRRGMTFDGSAAIASFDRVISRGYSRKVQQQRIESMATLLGVSQFDPGGLPTSEFLRLSQPASAFDLIHALLQQGGLGMIQPLWLGPTDDTIIPQSDDIADPDGTNGAPLGLTLAAFLSEA